MCLTVSVTKASEQLSVFRHHLDKRKVCTQGVEGGVMQILVTSMLAGEICIENNIRLAKTEKGDERGQRGAHL